MKFYRIYLLAFLASMFPVLGYTQDPHVHTKYVKESKKTVVTTDPMYVLDTPLQFIQLKLVGDYPGEQLVKPPSTVYLAVVSNTRKAMYRKDTKRKLLIIADGDSLSLVPNNYSLSYGETRGDTDIFWQELDFDSRFPRKRVESESPLPSGALIKGGKGVDGIVLELILVDLKLEHLLKIAKAERVEMQLGDTKFGLTENQMNSIRDFAKHLTL